ncbi:MAG: PLP-dependent aminotransferase family protein [Clostridia bacterium]
MNESRFAKRMKGMKGNAIRELLSVSQQPGMISFAGGLPSSETFDTETVANIAHDVLMKDGKKILQYGSTEGYAPLREELIKYLQKDGFNIGHENLLITSGAQQGIDLVSKALIDPGDVVVVESPSYLAALQIFKTYEAKLVIVPSDENGMIVSELERVIEEHKPKIIYSVPTFQNPSSATMTLSRRKDLCDILDKNELVLVEDNPYGDLRYSGEDQPKIYNLDRSNQTLYLGTFSKIISPGLRVGFAIGNEDLINKMRIGKQGTDVQTTTLAQAIICEYFKRDILESHIESIKDLYRKKRDHFLKKMKEFFPASVKWNYPEGGLFVWAELPEQYDSQKLFKIAISRNVAFVPGDSFFVNNKKNCLRLNFSNASFDEMDEGLERLGKAISEMIE